MKIKATKAHLVFKMTRKEYAAICRVLDLGFQDIELPSSYAKDADVASTFVSAVTAPQAEPRFLPVPKEKFV